MRDPDDPPQAERLTTTDECKKAERILASLITPTKSKSGETDFGIPRKILSHAKVRPIGSTVRLRDRAKKAMLQGLAIFTSFKVGAVSSIRFGSGLIIARLPTGGWSAPSAMGTGGIGFGTQIGIELTDFVFVLNSEEAVRTFTQAGSLTLGKNVSVAFGPYGRSAEVGGAVGSNGMAGMFAYSKSRGIFGGKSFEGGILGERLDANENMYGDKLTARMLLSGRVAPPPETEPLMQLLNSECFQALPVETEMGQLSIKHAPSDVAKLPPNQAHGMPNEVAELAGGEKKPRLVAEMDAGPQHAVYEMPADDQKIYHELPSDEKACHELPADEKVYHELPADEKVCHELPADNEKVYYELDASQSPSPGANHVAEKPSA